ncbi:hypothetical protein [Streptomyces sp. NBC_01190]|uniref:hypothetical protein n=1 Tax=Streptomyces sp. NBC_01190 TaxID=2903767 RepID=UPI00386605B6|nr:hypothetical protein OG519_27460 [Streptomyces sp. NBC_01190]
MADRALVSCPACGQENHYTPPTFACACGVPLVPAVRPGEPGVHIRHLSWEDSWVRVRCPACGRCDQWPRPEFDCACGALVRLPVGDGETPAVPAPDGPRPAAGGAAAHPGSTRPHFRPVTVRTARDVLATAERYLKWLGFAGVRPAGDRSATGVDLRGDGLVAQVDPTTLPTAPRAVECLWLNCANEDAAGAFFSLAGFAQEARASADRLGVPLFVLDLTGTPRPVNDAADALVRAGPVRGG